MKCGFFGKRREERYGLYVGFWLGLFLIDELLCWNWCNFEENIFIWF